MLHHYISTGAQNGQTKHWFKGLGTSFVATTGSPTRSEGESGTSCLQFANSQLDSAKSVTLVLKWDKTFELLGLWEILATRKLGIL